MVTESLVLSGLGALLGLAPALQAPSVAMHGVLKEVRALPGLEGAGLADVLPYGHNRS